MRKPIPFILILSLALTSCMPQAEVEAGVTALSTAATAAPTMAAVDVLLPAAEPTAAPTPVPTPTPTPAPTAVPEWVGIEDNGVDGVGTVRGNTNGNLAVGGDVASDGKVACYFRYASNSQTQGESWVLLCRDLATGRDRTLFEIDTDGVHIGGIEGVYLNLYRGYLYYLCDGAWRVPVIGGEPEPVLEADAWRMLAAYGEIYITRRARTDDYTHETVVLDADTLQELRVLPEFELSGAMDGRLYGCLNREHKEYVSMDPDGSDVRQHAYYAFETVPCCGALYVIPYEAPAYDGTLPNSRVLKIDVETGETQEFVTSHFFCSGYINVTERYLYLQIDGHDACGDIWRMPTDGGALVQFDSRIYVSGIPLIGDTAALDLVPCAVKSY